jgi:hypothetical protein
MGKILAIIAIFWQVVVFNGVKKQHFGCEFYFLLFLVNEK